MKRLKVNAVWFVEMTNDDAKSYLENVSEVNNALADLLEDGLETSHEIIVTTELEEV